MAFPVQHQHQQLVTSALLQGSNDNNVWVAPSGHFPQKKGSVPPTDIVGLPGYDKENDNEQQLSSVSRLVPDSYLEFRNILITECHNRKAIRLAQARTLTKIDVNKTRKILNFLLEKKLIYFPSWFVAPTCCNHILYIGKKETSNKLQLNSQTSCRFQSVKIIKKLPGTIRLYNGSIHGKFTQPNYWIGKWKIKRIGWDSLQFKR